MLIHELMRFGASGVAQAAAGRSVRTGVPWDVLIWIGVLIVVVVAGGLVLIHLQKRILKPPAGAGASGIMEELRRMRDSGAMTEEEYDATRRTMARKLAPSLGAKLDAPAAGQPGRPREVGRDDGGRVEGGAGGLSEGPQGDDSAR